MFNKKAITKGLALVAKMVKRVESDDTWEVKVCIHGNPETDPIHDHRGVSFWIENKGNDNECPGCFGSRMCDSYNAAVDRIWALLAPIALEEPAVQKSSSGKEVSISEMLVRAHMAWEIAEDMSFASGYDDLDNVMAADEAEATKRGRRLDGPIQKLLGKAGKRLQSSQGLAGKLNRVVTRYLEHRKRIEAILDRQDKTKTKIDAEAKKTGEGD
jgi:hypothetical protein